MFVLFEGVYFSGLKMSSSVWKNSPVRSGFILKSLSGFNNSISRRFSVYGNFCLNSFRATRVLSASCLINPALSNVFAFFCVWLLCSIIHHPNMFK